MTALGHQSVLNAMNGLANYHQRKHEYEEAMELYEQCLDICETHYGRDDANTLTTMNNLAVLYTNTEEREKALPLYIECYETRKKIYGETHPDTLMSLHNLANYHASSVSDGEEDSASENMEHLDKALELYLLCVKQYSTVLGEDHPDTFHSLDGLAHIYYRMNDYENALTTYEKCNNKRRNNLGDDHVDTIRTKNARQTVLEQLGLDDE